ncbi:uncharacterized protein CIMG_00509 [Coccidioides immitis RS]|uniref:Uncharacterized protein n=5 Tax=Coccidioides TaxID=5500 RepID=J3KH56_COCIM|nr:uncharacterized protein CIMG_00509 [Coccidioides immitis RS]XP_003066496.1 hypothetical protein CPC735_057210 [Coccidioides posadasii C735 delta SOWgp]EFW18579.1 conserved hypothetical protein [Coccidioides posadasii str. Silveira]KMM66041.1 hypothetical protein CPAG_02381 [Coccidioides posadasii RMSCC 3488]KMP00377.1 hypothetical protein CIRG_00519 [Coccidioides immitis RMSCC 2394]EAS35155.3 hypothetical protein CIMG_00509 [Coccidioides immitis RS]EER24351.1 hypothetical protein CPC735_05|eukprot:XP_003066496.1 hypothetical protein CPC735_057210 [Coccidioides posadasii C735 delta SOWgp]
MKLLPYLLLLPLGALAAQVHAERDTADISQADVEDSSVSSNQEAPQPRGLHTTAYCNGVKKRCRSSRQCGRGQVVYCGAKKPCACDQQRGSPTYGYCVC